MDPAELRLKNLIKPEQFPYTCKTGWEYDSGDYPRALRASRRRSGPAASSWASVSASSPRPSARAAQAHGHPRPRHGRRRRAADPPDRQGGARISVQTQGQGHETTFAQIVAEELGLSPDDVEVVHGDTDQTPFGLGTYGSRSTPVSGAAAAVVARKVRERARIVASAMLEVDAGRPGVGGAAVVRPRRPGPGQTIAEIAMAAHSAWSCPRASRATWTPPASTTRRT
jgi:carbon-monoxide dehydrogenase large subunit